MILPAIFVAKMAGSAAFFCESGREKGLLRAKVCAIAARSDLVQAKFAERMACQRVDGFPGEPLAPLCAVTDQQADISACVMSVDGADLDIADMSSAIPEEHTEHKIVGIGIRGFDKIYEVRFGVTAESRFQELHESGIVHPLKIGTTSGVPR